MKLVKIQHNSIEKNVLFLFSQLSYIVLWTHCIRKYFGIRACYLTFELLYRRNWKKRKRLFISPLPRYGVDFNKKFLVRKKKNTYLLIPFYPKNIWKRKNAIPIVVSSKPPFFWDENIILSKSLLYSLVEPINCF